MITALYLRQSLDAEGLGLAIARQRTECTQLCQTKGWDDVREYVDNSVSASSRKPRPAYQQLLADIRAGMVAAVVVWDLDRLHRQPRELEEFIDLADQHRLKLATVTGDVDLSTDNGRLVARLKGAVARAEVERKSARQKAAHRQRVSQGRPWGDRRPFGYQPDRITPDPLEAPILARIYADAIAGVSQSEIARQLNREGVTTTLGNLWTQNAVRNLLVSPRYAGRITHLHQEAGEAGWPALVTEDVWQAAQRVTHRSGGRRTPTALLTGTARCGVCGEALSRAVTGAGAKLYVCRTNHCVGRNADRLEEWVVNALFGWLDSHGHAALTPSPTSDTATLHAEADLLRERLQQVAEMYADGDLTLPEWKAARDRAKTRLDRLQAAIGEHGTAPLLRPLLDADAPEAGWANLDPARQRAVVAALCTVTVNRTRKGARFDPDDITIIWWNELADEPPVPA